MASYSGKMNSYQKTDEDEDDIDDEKFLRRPAGSMGFVLNDGQSNLNRYSNPNVLTLEEQRQMILEKRRQHELESIRITEKSLNSLRDTEEGGASIAEELYRQREKLERTEKSLDDINTTLRFSQRHIQGIKSVFGGLKNLISGKSGTLPSASSKNITESTSSASSNDYRVIDRSNAQKMAVQNSMHPGLKIRGLCDTDDNSTMESNAQAAIDNNLDHMLSSIYRIKDLSYTLGDEIESQNDLIDRVMDKTEKADGVISKQNKDIQKILK